MIISAPLFFSAVEISDVLARNFDQNGDGDQVRMISSVRPLQNIANAINFLLANNRRVIASCYMSTLRNTYEDCDPIFLFRFKDTANNARLRIYNILYLNRTVHDDSATNAIIRRYSETENGLITDHGTNYDSTLTRPDDLKEDGFIHARGDKSNSLEYFGVSTFEGAELSCVVVQEFQQSTLNTDDHDAAPIPTIGTIATSKIQDKIRSAMQTLQDDYLPVFVNWSAQKPTNGSRPSASDKTGFVISAESATNILDGSSTTRTATSPGFVCHVKYFGLGPITKEDGKKVAVKWSILAETDDSSACSAILEGPDFLTVSNKSTISVTASTPTWYEGDTVYLDSSQDNDETTDAMNKLDLSGMVATAGKKLWIYAIAIYMIAE